jgi:mannose/cellobiose epimerase-like protein (N-acyl-D-glucosamine 2-epimerase family)
LARIEEGRAAGVEMPADVAAWRRWLAEEVAPFWVRRVVAPEGYLEYLTPQGEPAPLAAQDPLVTARLIYCFSQLHLLGAAPSALEAARHGFRFLTERCWDQAEGGFFHGVSTEGEPLDRGKHAYDMAYVLFGLAWWNRASGEQAPLTWAQRTADYLDAHLRDPRRGGYRAAVAAERAETDLRPRELAAQMHLLEAFQALHRATGEGAWLARTEAMAAFIRERLIDRETGSLGELYTADWEPRAGREGELREPGDNFEVAWMLYGHARLTGDARARAAADGLYEFCLRHGVDSTPGFLPAAFAQVTRCGEVVKDAKPLWAQTELVKAALGRLEATGDPAAAALARRHLGLIFRHYLVDRRGLWRNELARDGSDVRVTLPVRVLYHLLLCFAEVMRLWQQLQVRDVRQVYF